MQEAPLYLNAMRSAPLYLNKGSSQTPSWASASLEISEWWSRRTDLHAWRKVASRVFAYTITSACVERVFSHVDARDKKRGNALEDSREVASMAWYNGRLFSTKIPYKH